MKTFMKPLPNWRVQQNCSSVMQYQKHMPQISEMWVIPPDIYIIVVVIVWIHSV
jgi:hypothetical protein